MFDLARSSERVSRSRRARSESSFSFRTSADASEAARARAARAPRRRSAARSSRTSSASASRIAFCASRSCFHALAFSKYFFLIHSSAAPALRSERNAASA